MIISKNKILKIIFLGAIILAFSLIRINFILGSFKCFFSGINFTMPVLGLLFSLPVSGFLLSSFFIIKKLLFGGALTLGIPTFFATLSLIYSAESTDLKNKFFDFILRVLVPIFCIILFVLHPIGLGAFLYSFYWFIPIALYFLNFFNKYSSLFTRALSATFIAHAVGSVIWLYTIGLSSFKWLKLIPVVAVERLVFASGICLAYYFLVKILAVFDCEVEKKRI